MTPSRAKVQETTAKAFAVDVARLCADLKCDDVMVIDLRGISQVCHFVVIATGTSSRQMRSVGSDIEELGDELGHRTYRRSADDTGTWVVIDCVDVVIHLFEPEQRAFYDLESLWADAPRLPWRRDAKAATDANATPRR